jgi:hypothetical protein
MVRGGRGGGSPTLLLRLLLLRGVVGGGGGVCLFSRGVARILVGVQLQALAVVRLSDGGGVCVT